MGMDSFKVFLKKLMMLDEKSLKLSKNVLDLRKQLQATILGLRPQLDHSLQLMESIRKEINIIETNKDKINQCKDFNYKYKKLLSDDLRKKYVDSSSNLSAAEQILNNLYKEFEDILVDCYKKSEDIKKAVEELKKISLHVNPNENYEEYIKCCIKNEEVEKKKGFLDRIKGYKFLLDIHSKINKAFHEQNIFDDLEKFKNEIIQEILKKNQIV